ncbi:MAG TPA: LuxR C-terminal-related transcriptional regulator [Ferruginibacter sp.]|nr:LuxR C-terminal-related transcriptional regulator [Ferruginibacter sp.]
MKKPAHRENAFIHELGSWSNSIAKNTSINWTEQLSILNDVEELITADLSLEEITAAIYENVNQLMDAFQFAVGIYDEKEGLITYKGMIEDGKKMPDFSMEALDSNRLASWCIRNEKEIFMNDLDTEFSKYLERKPVPLAGSDPKAAIYVPLRLNNKVVGLIVVRSNHKNVYSQHHLYILKTVGNFVIRTLELSKISAKPFVKMQGSQKQWRWCDKKELPSSSGKALALLTEREKEVLFLLVTGLENKAIAAMLFVSPGTIKTHTLNIYQKMEVANRTSAILKALELGWII